MLSEPPTNQKHFLIYLTFTKQRLHVDKISPANTMLAKNSKLKHVKLISLLPEQPNKQQSIHIVVCKQHHQL